MNISGEPGFKLVRVETIVLIFYLSFIRISNYHKFLIQKVFRENEKNQENHDSLAFKLKLSVPLQEEGWVVCKAFKKKTSVQAKTNERWDPSHLHDEQTSSIISRVDPIDLILRQPQRISAQNFMYKQEIEAEADTLLRFMHSEQLVPLPQLQSPSLTKRQNSMPIISEKVTDWRDLDKFVASQLSQEDHRHETSSDMSLFLLQSSKDDEENKLSSFLTTRSDCDIGICVFEN